MTAQKKVCKDRDGVLIAEAQAVSDGANGSPTGSWSPLAGADCGLRCVCRNNQTTVWVFTTEWRMSVSPAAVQNKNVR